MQPSNDAANSPSQEAPNNSPEQLAAAKVYLEKRQRFAQQIAAVNQVPPSGVFSFHTHFDMVRQFHVGAMGRGASHVGLIANFAAIPRDVLQSRYGVLKEEFGETGGIEFLGQLARGEKALTLENLATLLDWICDMNYFLLGLAVNCDLPYDTAFLAVHQSNMNKVMRLDGPIFREDGKVMKPEGWKEPPVWDIIQQHYSEAKGQEQGGEAAGVSTR